MREKLHIRQRAAARTEATRIFGDAADQVLAIILIFLVMIPMYFVLHNTALAVGGVYPCADAAPAAAESGRLLPDSCVAWVSIDGSRINCPVVQGAGEDVPFGCAVLDGRNAADFSDGCSLVCAPELSGDVQTGALDCFCNASYFDQHRRGMLTVGDTTYLLQVFAVLVTDADGAAFSPSETSGVDLETVKSDALRFREPGSEHLLALTACADSGGDGRIVVLCAIGETLHRVQRLSFYE